MKRVIASLVSLLIALSIGAQEVRIGVFIHAPHVYKNETGDGVYGPAIDYISSIVAEMGYTPVFRLFPLPRILVYLESGSIDLSLELVRTPEREAYLYYSEKPCFTMVPSLTFPAASPISRITAASDVGKLNIGFLTGAEIPSFFDAAPSVVFETVSGDSWIRQNLAKLMTGRIDAAMDMNAYSYREEAKKQGIEDKIKTLNIPGEGTNYYVVFSKASPKGLDLLKKYDALIETGQFNEQEMIEAFISK